MHRQCGTDYWGTTSHALRLCLELNGTCCVFGELGSWATFNLVCPYIALGLALATCFSHHQITPLIEYGKCLWLEKRVSCDGTNGTHYKS